MSPTRRVAVLGGVRIPFCRNNTAYFDVGNLGLSIKTLGAQPLLGSAVGCGAAGLAFYLLKMNSKVVDELVVNMVDVGEETGELDTMLYKVADIFDEEVTTLTDGLMKLIEPLLICFLGGAVGFIVISLFLPLISLIQGLS